MTNPIKSKAVCSCKECTRRKKNASTSTRKFFKRLANKRVRKMDIEKPFYIHSTILS